jgi:hypothetical protein
MEGSQVAELLPVPSVSVNAVTDVAKGAASNVVAWPGVKTPTPDDAVAAPEAYETADLPTDSAAVPPPVVNVVVLAVAVHDAARLARVSVTVTTPSGAVSVAPGAALPRAAEAGALMTRDPPPIENVVVVAAAPAGVGAKVMASAAASSAAALT